MGAENNWILCDSDYSSIEWSYEYFPDVGIISKSHCDFIFLYSRFEEYENTDCPKCHEINQNYSIENESRFKCIKCGHKFSLTSGTYLESSKIEFIYWYRLAFLISNLHFPINSVRLSLNLGLTQKTVYSMLITIKNAMKIDGSGLRYNLPQNTKWMDIISNLLKLKNK